MYTLKRVLRYQYLLNNQTLSFRAHHLEMLSSQLYQFQLQGTSCNLSTLKITCLKLSVLQASANSTDQNIWSLAQFSLVFSSPTSLFSSMIGKAFLHSFPLL